MSALYSSVILMGMKHSGKSTLGARLAWTWRKHHADLDDITEKTYRADRSLTCREIYLQHGRSYFCELEAKAAAAVATMLEPEGIIVSLGGGTIENSRAMDHFVSKGLFVYLKEDLETLYKRILRGGVPAFLSNEDPHGDFEKLYLRRTKLYEAAADLSVDLRENGVDESFTLLRSLLGEAGYAG